MAVKHFHHATLQVPDVAAQFQFYKDFGLTGRARGNNAVMRCKDRKQDQVIITEGSTMGLHDLSFGATKAGIRKIQKRAEERDDVSVIDPPKNAPYRGLWIRHDFDGMIYNVNDDPAAKSLGGVKPAKKQPEYKVNTPGHFYRVNEKLDLPIDTKPVPRRFGHMVHFTPDVDRKVDFYSDVLGLQLTDRSGDLIAFMRPAGGSDHHVVGFVKDKKPGFHHISFEVGNPDEVGMGGQSLLNRGYRNGWGFGRHALGSNFFWYVRDPHMGLCEYFSDIDYIAEDDKWTPRDWPIEVAFYLWGPPPPKAFGTNYTGNKKVVKPESISYSRV